MASSEIEQLKLALSNSPSNQVLRKILVEKLVKEAKFDAENEKILKESVKMYPEDSFFSEQLIAFYYKQSKYSICITIYENFSNTKSYNNEIKAMISEAYLELNDIAKAKTIYFEIIDTDSDYVNEKLGKAFKLTNTTQGNNKNITGSDSLFVKSDIKFRDVGGHEEIKKQIDMKIIKPLQNKRLFEKYGKKTGGGILFFGPPGCGKTFIAKATAGEIDSKFLSIGLNDILDMYLGNSEKNITKYFSLARSHTPCVLFIDEVDALGANRESFQQNVGKGVVNQLLNEMDGINNSNEGILIIGATNTPWQIDNALLRPGRFGKVIFVPPPNIVSRQIILKLKLSNKPVDKINYQKVAKLTMNFSGADIDALVDVATENVLEEAIQTGKERNLTTADLIKASSSIIPSTTTWFNIVKNYVEYGNKSGLYNDVKSYMIKNRI